MSGFMTAEIKKHESEIKKYRDQPKGVSEWILIFSRDIKKWEIFDMGLKILLEVGDEVTHFQNYFI